MSNGVGLHCPDLTAGTPLYTPNELGVDDADADVAPEPPDHPAPVPAGGPAAATTPRRELTDAAVEGG
jgi:hypothetical protein